MKMQESELKELEMRYKRIDPDRSPFVGQALADIAKLIQEIRYLNGRLDQCHADLDSVRTTSRWK